jgi:uncharacterized MAPEG superfamily protein
METIKFIQVGLVLHMTGVEIVAAFIHKISYFFLNIIYVDFFLVNKFSPFS